ncbi:MAG: MgtC/SapB family protein, partial [Myxococcaceae bacterium]
MDVIRWPAFETLSRMLLALGVGLFVGLEREWRGKEAGLRTFAFVSLLGGELAAFTGPARPRSARRRSPVTAAPSPVLAP